MADTKKFLDQAGVSSLWDKIIVEVNKKANASDISTLQTDMGTAKSDITKLKSDVSANTSAITTLNGTGNGSVTKTVADAIAGIVASAPESLDTLKEISDWITEHGEDASAMNTAILKAQSDASTALTNVSTAQTTAEGAQADVDALATLVGTLPEGEDSATIVAYINKMVSGIASSGAIEALTARVEAVETAKHTHSNSAALNAITTEKINNWDTSLASAKSYTDTAVSGLDKMVALTEAEIVAAITRT